MRRAERTRKITSALVATLLITMCASNIAYAFEWQCDPSTYEAGVLNREWQKQETLVAMDKWVSERKDAILALSTEREKVQACINAVCDYYDYDTRSAFLHPAYVYESHLATCKDFARDFEALLTAVGIENYEVMGYLTGVLHAWNRVKVDGTWYWFDMTSADTDSKRTRGTYMVELPEYYQATVEPYSALLTGEIYIEDGGDYQNQYNPYPRVIVEGEAKKEIGPGVGL